MTKHVTVTLDEESLTVLDGIASNMEQSREETITMALREWLAGQADFEAQVRAGIADADAGNFVSHEEVERIALKYDAAR